jgi:hypothetical protein
MVGQTNYCSSTLVGMAGEGGDGGAAATTARLEEITTWLASCDVAAFGGHDLALFVVAVERLLNGVHALSAQALEGYELDGSWAADGALSAARWIAARTGTAPAALNRRVRTGEALRLLPDLSARARAGHLSVEHQQALGDLVRRHPGLAVEHEAELVERAESLDAERFGVACRRWLEGAADADAPDPLVDVTGSHGTATAADPQSRLSASRTVDGCLRLDGWFAPADADLLDAALGAGVDRQLRAAADGDPSLAGRPVSVLRASALVDLAAQSMRHEPSDVSAPDRYRVAVVVHPGETTNPPEAACDHVVAYRAALGAKGEVLDIGRQRARWPPGIRRAITLRDGGCVFPGCDRPPSWADIHHCTPVRRNGATSVDNGALLCRRHHTFVHAHGWRITVDQGNPVVRRPDGQPHTIRKWPSALASNELSPIPGRTDRPPPATRTGRRE